MYQKLFQGVPTKPVLMAAPIIILFVLGLYYFNQYQRCTEQTKLREQLYSILNTGTNEIISLTDIFNFNWDKAYVIPNFKPDRKLKGCPFNWGWSEKYRGLLIDKNLLNIIFFTLNNKRVGFIEFSNHKIRLEGFNNQHLLLRDMALLELIKTNNSENYILLKPVERL